MKHTLRVVAAFFLAQAFVLSGDELSGDVLRTPLEVGQDNFNNDHSLFAFGDDHDIQLIDPVLVGIRGLNGIIPAGTTVASHYAADNSAGNDVRVLGIAALAGTMAAAEFLAKTDVVYFGTELRGPVRGDIVWIDDNDPHRLWVFWARSPPEVYVRVFTEKSLGALMM